MWYVMEGRFISLGRRYDFSEDELFFLHYKLPSSHPEQRDHFRGDGTTVYAPEWLDASYGRRAVQYCDPAWKLSAANPEWKRIMEHNEWRPPTNA